MRLGDFYYPWCWCWPGCWLLLEGLLCRGHLFISMWRKLEKERTEKKPEEPGINIVNVKDGLQGWMRQASVQKAKLLASKSAYERQLTRLLLVLSPDPIQKSGLGPKRKDVQCPTHLCVLLCRTGSWWWGVGDALVYVPLGSPCCFFIVLVCVRWWGEGGGHN